MSGSRLEKVRSSIFRSKSDSPSPRRTSRPFSRILPSPRPKEDDERPQDLADDPEDVAVGPNGLPGPSASITQLPLNPQTSPASNHETLFDNHRPPRDFEVPLPSRELQYDDQSSDVGLASEGYRHDQIYSDTSELDERYMKRKLMDMESSFMPEYHVPGSARSQDPSKTHQSSAGALRQPHGNNTYQEEPSFQSSMSSRTSHPFQTPAEHFQTPATRHTYRISEEKTGDLDQDGDTETPMKHSLSSPSAAAAQRSKLRAAAGYTPLRNATTLALTNSRGSSKLEPRSSRDDGTERPSSAPHESMHATPDERKDEVAGSNNPPDNEQEHGRDSHSSEQQRSSGEQLKPSTGKRPSYLKSRQASARSSASSYLSNEGGSDLAGSGGVTPGSFSTVRPGRELSRLPSLGSVASTMSINTERSASYRKKREASGNAASAAQETNLEPVAEDRAKTLSPPETPHVGNQHSPEPRDTVVARNVRNVEVPATVARNYREAQAFGSSSKSFGAPNFARTKGELTLKEQNNRIDKLSKENFDLKLKIHYLYQALQDRSDEGVKDLISKNAQLSTDIIKVRKENQALRKRVKQLEREQKAKEDGMSAVRTVSESEDLASSRSWQQAQLEEEIAYLRDRMQVMEEDNERLRKGDVAREYEKRRMADQVRSMTGGDAAAVLRDEVEQQKAGRERAEREIDQLRLEISRVRAERSPVRGLHLHPQQQTVAGRPSSKSSGNSHDIGSLSGTTIVDQLRQENADLRRDLGAQTSMLTSRNRERERLQQEIEDLKLLQRRGEGFQSSGLSVSGDSLLDRSVSRNHLRPASRASTQKTNELSEGEKDRYESKQALLRDENSGLRMRIQDLQTELDMLTGSAEHLENLRRERDDALILIEEERDFAADAIDRLEAQMEQKDNDFNQLLAELRAKEDESQALEKEINDISASLSRLSDEGENSFSRIQNLEQDLTLANGECEAAQQNLRDTMAAKERLEVQAESSQSEIAFLREEQESDKIKISDLQSALARAKTNLRDEKERLQEFEEMEAETKKARDEARRLKKALGAKEEEANMHRENLDEFGDTLRHATGSTEQSVPMLLKSVGRLRRELDTHRADLEQSKGGLEQKNQKLQDHIMLLEASETERIRLSNALEKERQARRQDRLELDRRERSPTGGSRIAELEQARFTDQRRMDDLERSYNEALRERNELLHDVWTRLSTLCGPEWLDMLAATAGQEVPTFETIQAQVSSLEVPISMALDTIAQTLSTFRTRIRSAEKEMYKDLEALSYDLDDRTKRINELEQHLSQREANGLSPNAQAAADLAQLKHENKLLRRELKILKQGAFALPGLPSPQLELDNAAQEAALVEHERMSQGMGRAVSSHRSRRQNGEAAPSEHSALQRPGTSNTQAPTESDYGGSHAPSVNGRDADQLAPSEQRWVLRLKELEKKLVKERELRELDRDGARKRLIQRDNEARELKRQLDMEKQRGALRQAPELSQGASTEHE